MYINNLKVLSLFIKTPVPNISLEFLKSFFSSLESKLTKSLIFIVFIQYSLFINKSVKESSKLSCSCIPPTTIVYPHSSYSDYNTSVRVCVDVCGRRWLQLWPRDGGRTRAASSLAGRWASRLPDGGHTLPGSCYSLSGWICAGCACSLCAF